MTEIATRAAAPEAPAADTPRPGVSPAAGVQRPLYGVGERRARFDALGRVRGTISYAGDEPVGPGTAFVGVHRSTMPHARIVAVDASAALEIEGVLAVVTGRDLYEVFGDRIYTGPAFSDQPCLAVDKVRYVGEAVAAVLATDLATARAAAEEVAVEYEELPPVYDIADGLRGDSFVHEELRPSSVFADLAHLRGVRDTNVCYEYRQISGDAAAEHAAATTTVSATTWAPPTHHVPIELPSTTAWVDSDRLEMLSTTQTPSYVRQTISNLLDLPLSRVRVMTRPLGGSFGCKMYDRFEPLAAALAWTTRRRIRIDATREEAFLLTSRHGAEVAGSISADAEGDLVAFSSDVRYDTGAFADVGPRITAKSGLVAPGPYRIKSVDVRSRCVYTNKVSAGPFRGFGVPQVTWSHETLIDELAHELGEDPYLFRRRHLLREGDVATVGTPMHSADFVTCIDEVTKAVGWDERTPEGDGRWVHGKGVAVGMKAVLTPTIANATLNLNQDGSATLLISTVDMGQGSDTIMAQIAGQVLRLDSRLIHVVRADTDATPYDTITAGSRSTYHTGNAVRLVAEAMRDKLLGFAAEQWDVPAEELRLDTEGVVHVGGDRRISVQDLVCAKFGARGATVTTAENFTSWWVPYDHDTGLTEKATEHWFAGAAAVRLAVDTYTGRIRTQHLAVAGDVGKAINPTLVEQQLAGAALMGLGHTLFDELVYDQGQLTNATLLDYQLPSFKDVPEKLTPIIVESAHRDGPFGAKGVGETAILAIAPAYSAAVRDACGARITTLPLTPERVLNHLTSLTAGDGNAREDRR
ncbi:xanthine dehydrogenase family protein molybdopterin-binding subunit [Amycolatopsis methanolica]|uniref:Xanthine dehydrogenase n=1 Tax=Amycolatopsis methanolica 239 TaxID=1068978 RepID=A0A076MME7_AMYME|nr:xanthine dehydrogenase family protein molybdopterin-binding subunit [Amycolatopsis methanolica]AIJ21904.1 xanthine dehydrogenase [Amycolatopsis methanolica 239]